MKNAKSGICLVACIAMLLAASILEGQDPQHATSAPVPQQILGARKIFISNGGAERNVEGDLPFSGGPDRPYNQFYAAIKTWGKYEMVPVPAAADVVFEISLIAVEGSGYYQLRLVIRDPKTSTILWTFAEHARVAGRQKTRDAAFDRAMSILIDDVKKLGTQNIADDTTH